MPKIAKKWKRNPRARHVKAWTAYRERKGRPKAKLPPSKGKRLSKDRYTELIINYCEQARRHSKAATELAVLKARSLSFLAQELLQQGDFKALTKLIEAAQRLPTDLGPPVSINQGYHIVREIISDFKRTKNLKVFGFGVGYGQLLFLMKKFMGMKVKGVELRDTSSTMTKWKRLRVVHGKSASDPSLVQMGKFDVTYSIGVFENDIMDRETALGMLGNMAAMTRKGGKSYHVIYIKQLPVTREEIARAGFRINKLKDIGSEMLFLKLTKNID